MEILVVTPEVAPYSGDSDLADVAAVLSKALKGLDHQVTVVSPLYRGIDPTKRSLARRLTKLEVELDGAQHACEVYDGRTAGGVDLTFIGHEEIFRAADGMETEGESPETVAIRAGLFAKAVVELARTRDMDVIHGHGWPGALAVAEAAEATEMPTVLTVHDPAYQGRFDPSLGAKLGLSDELRRLSERDGQIVALVAGLKRAVEVTTVSPTYAREITTEPEGCGLGDVFAELGQNLTGVLDGIDVAVWNPATDARLVARFDPMDLEGKARCKADLQRNLGMPVRGDVPLMGMMATGREDDGFDLFAKVTTQVLRNDCQVVVGWEGDPEDELHGVLREVAERWPDRFAVAEEDREHGLRHRLIGASDFVLVPSRRQPCGFVQMQAHRYGALPVARRTGGLADTVIDCDAKLTTGTGFLFDEATPDAVLAAVRRAFAAFTQDEAFEVLRRRVMTIDHSWERGARLYERIYRDSL